MARFKGPDSKSFQKTGNNRCSAGASHLPLASHRTPEFLACQPPRRPAEYGFPVILADIFQGAPCRNADG